VPSLSKRALKWSAHAVDRLGAARRGVVVLIYHRVGARTPLDVDLPRASFADQMAELADTGRVRTLDEALGALAGPTPAGPDPIVITFDDGTADFAEDALPVLAEHGLPVTLYTATRFVDEGVEFPHGGRPLSWGALRDAHATGLVTVGSHTHAHALLDRMEPDAVHDELARADDLIADHVGVRPAHFAYPKAVPGSGPADAAVRARYRSAALAGTRPNRYGATDPHRLARSPIQTSDGDRYFRAKVAGGMHLEDGLRALANRWRYRGATG
jgi:peptidoglycan/xylan/chitin deacetylase (PgdA/CDA1 family)